MQDHSSTSKPDSTPAAARAAEGADAADAAQAPALPPHDCHVHMALDGQDFKAALARHQPAPHEQFVRAMLGEYARRGYVYVREGGDKHGAGWLARRLAPAYGLEYASPVFPLFQTGNYGGFIGRGFQTIAEYRELVDQVVTCGGDYVKVMISGIMDFDHYGRITGHPLPRDLVGQMVAYAHDCGLAVMAHVNGARAVQDAAEAGVDSVEHGYYTDADARAALVENNVIWVPTFAPIHNLVGTGRFSDDVLGRIEQSQRQAVAQVAAAGGIIACGSDAGAAGVPHVQGGFDEQACLRAAIGADANRVLARGLAETRRRFPQRLVY